MAAEGWQERLANFDPRPKKRSYLWAVVFAFGVLFLIGPVLPGWTEMEESLGGTTLLRVLVAFLFFFCASFVRSIHGLRLQVQELTESVDAANSAIYGKNWKAERNAVEILIGCLEGPGEELQKKARENLRLLTGQNFGSDLEAWKKWWAENRTSFRKATRS